MFGGCFSCKIYGNGGWVEGEGGIFYRINHVKQSYPPFTVGTYFPPLSNTCWDSPLTAELQPFSAPFQFYGFAANLFKNISMLKLYYIPPQILTLLLGSSSVYLPN
jgi:hypothetical protein